jgi:hypothetical protein
VASNDVWCGRVLSQGLIETFRGGRLAFDPARRIYARAPRLDLADRTAAVLQARVTAATDDVPARAALENYLRDAVVWLAAFGQEAEAARMLEQLRRAVTALPPVADPAAFAHRDVAARLVGAAPQAAAGVSVGYLVRSLEWQQAGDAATARGFERLARLYGDEGRRLPGGAEAAALDWDRIQAEAQRRVAAGPRWPAEASSR